MGEVTLAWLASVVASLLFALAGGAVGFYLGVRAGEEEHREEMSGAFKAFNEALGRERAKGVIHGD